MEPESAKRSQNRATPNKQQVTGGIEITFYTDPLCCYTWVMQPHWKKFLEEFRETVNVTYKMVGLLPSWNNFSDSLNSIRKPMHMAPEWLHATEISGVYIDNSIWISDPPASSFPACIAVKCVELQSTETAALYFSMVQEAVMTKGLNIARTAILLELADQLSQLDLSFNVYTFRQHLLGESGKEAFRKDWQEAKYRDITRFPTLVFHAAGQNPVLLSGFQSYESLSAFTHQFIPIFGP